MGVSTSSLGWLLPPQQLNSVECCSATTGDNYSVVDLSQPPMNRVTLLLGDIGGTNCRFELVEADFESRERLQSGNFCKTFGTREFPSFEETLQAFLKVARINPSDITICCLAVAGPVSEDRCYMTNLSWEIDGPALTKGFGFKTVVLNDFVAVGYAIPTLTEKDVLTINAAEKNETGPIAVLGPGTGLGEVQLFWDTGLQEYVAWASEGSHSGFAPRGELQRALLEFCEQDLSGPCEVEHVACGSGLERLYRFLCHYRKSPTQPLLPEDITERGLSGKCQICSEAIDLFLAIIGAEASSMALRSMATGGVFIAGGIPPRLVERIKTGGLAKSYLHSESRFSKTVSSFPLYVLTVEAGLRGVFNYAMSVASRQMPWSGYDTPSRSSRSL